ncbi:MAG: hypothetical protein JWM68_1148, partial [Verrucomicrobiales bacterium]|nr:hypothetical protein [Verrucomicrobiales bacterium]
MFFKTILLTAVLSASFYVNQATAAETIRLAIINEKDSVAAANDLLTAELSQKVNLQLLERAQIDKVVREQTLAASGFATKDFLKIGQTLGADGVIVLEIQREGTNSVLNTRLVAVKPGVILRAMSAPWPMKNASEWAKLIAGKFAPLLPKLTVLPKDAVPISVLNLRGAANSRESIEADQELTLLLLNRLMLEKEVFVLERRKMGSLVEEKELQKTNESPFWNGSFLVDGVVDKNGFSKEQVTIDARLSPPSGGTPTAIAVAGSRKDLPKIVDELAKKILATLQKKSSLPEWKPAEEAAQFYDEATWALKWRMFREAQNAAESAWALGQRDKACADIRVRNYVYEILVGASPRTSPDEIYPFNPSPNRAKLDQAVHALELYYDYTKTLPADQPIIVSSWYFTGVEAVEAASLVLQNYYFVPAARQADADKLAELRSLIRETVARIYKSPTVHSAYWTGDRIDYSSVPNYKDPIPNPIKMEGEYRGSIIQSQFDWGCFWQETPEDCLAFYRELLTSDVFGLFSSRSLWFRGPHRPRLTAWNSEDQKRIPELWSRFLVELNGSTNFLHQIEAKSILLADAKTDAEIEPAFNDLFKIVFAHTNEIAKHNADFHYNWVLDELVGSVAVGAYSPVKDGLRKRFKIEMFPGLAAITSARIKYLTGITVPAEIHGTIGNDVMRRIASIDAAPATNALPLTQFFAIPKEKLASDVKSIEVCAYKFRQGKVWLDLEYHTEHPRRGKDGLVEYVFSAFAVMDLDNGGWEIIKRPVRNSYFVAGRTGETGEGPHFEVFHDAVYCSDRDQWQKYDLKTRRWETLALPGQILAQFFVIDDHLYG